MIKKLFTLFSSANDKENATPILNVIPPSKHSISESDLSPNALKVMRRLNESGFDSYLVGGGIRDLLLDGHPKDFDIATDAKPEQVKGLFKNSRIIGRRFRIVHVQYGREIIEVTTFRGQNDSSSQQVASDTGQLLRDNVYGDMESDALRRDFTANALYYSISDHSLYDYTKGIDDIEMRQLRMIGEPETRYVEDPVRLLRAIRFAAKLGFTIEENTAAPIRPQAHLLNHVPPARLFEEILKLLLGGCATATYGLLKEYELLPHLFPGTCKVLDEKPQYEQLIEEVMLNTDKRIRSQKRVTPAFIYAALLWPALRHTMADIREYTPNQLAAFREASQQVISQQLQFIMIPKRFLIPMRQIWELQLHLPNRAGKRAYRLLEHPKFRAGFDFLLMREVAGESAQNLGQWWDKFQQVDEQERARMVEQVNQSQPKKRRRPRNNKRSKSQQQDKPID